jgi:hypothetical protein
MPWCSPVEARRIGWRPGRDGSRLGHDIVLISILMLNLARGSRRLSGCAVILVPLVEAPWFALSERNSPGSIIVNMTAKRFMNESTPYVEACHHMYGGEYGQGPGPGPGENIPTWLVFDQQYGVDDVARLGAFGSTHWCSTVCAMCGFVGSVGDEFVNEKSASHVAA